MDLVESIRWGTTLSHIWRQSPLPILMRNKIARSCVYYGLYTTFWRMYSLWSRRMIRMLALEPVDPEDGTNCVMCWDRQAAVRFRPCGHVCFCEFCCIRAQELGELRRCPLCRSRITHIEHVSLWLHSPIA